MPLIDRDTAVAAVDQAEPLSVRAHEMLRDAILSNRIRPGERLSVSDLARRMKISRTPVREAVQQLIHEGLAVRVPNRGADVVRVGVEDLRQLFAVREVLDGLAARLACQQVRPDDLAELRAILDEHEVLLGHGADPKAHIDLDIRYHGRIRELSRNPHLVEILGRIQGKAHVAMHSLWRGAEAPRLALDEHRQVFEALSGGDPEDAERAARLHVARLQGRLSWVAPEVGPDGEPSPVSDSAHLSPPSSLETGLTIGQA